jgi:anti-sigma regulatory factor (Ser/Thr protein kinase)
VSVSIDPDAVVRPTPAHTALFYRDDADATARVVPIVESAIERKVAVLLCLDDAKQRLVAERLGEAVGGVTFLPAGVRYERPIDAMEHLASFVDAQLASGAAGVHSIGELTLDGSERDHEWIRYEAAVNEVFEALPVEFTCLYDGARLPVGALSNVCRTHALLDRGGGSVVSEAYTGARAACEHLGVVSIAPLRAPDHVLGPLGSSKHARAAVAEAIGATRWSRLDGSLELIVSELVTNAVLHARSSATLTMWLDADAVVVQVCDDGPGLDDPFAGLRPPAFPARGAGLWISRHLSTAMTVQRRTGGGTEVTVRLDLPA